ncbi:MAG: dTMP kinase [Thermoplasmatota archaeon]
MASAIGNSHSYPGVLLVVEGIDGSGKSTQLHLLRRRLEIEGFSVFFTEWNSSELVRGTLKEAKRKNLLTPTTFSLLHATDFADRYYYGILPALKAGMVVLADRYVYTALARDAARGVDAAWVKNLYRFAVKPDLALYFRVPIDVATERLVSARAKIKYYEAGMDMGLANTPLESFRLFQGRVLEEYDRVVADEGLQVVDAREPIRDQQELVRGWATKAIAARAPRKVVPE